MKRFFAFLLAVSMVAAMSVSAFGATSIDGNGSTSSSNNGEGEYTIGVSGNYSRDSAKGDVISVDINWDALKFTYTEGSSRYDPVTHKTTMGDSSWSDNKAGITVSNHSNVSITAGFDYTRESGVTAVGTFYSKNGNDFKALSDSEAAFTLATAEGTLKENAPSGTVYFGVSGGKITESQKLGVITVTLKTEWTTVTDEEQLKVALSAGGNVKLGGNITFSNSEIYVTNNTFSVLDLNGKTIYGALNLYGGTYTVTDSVGTGAIDSVAAKHYSIYVSKNTKLSVTGGTFTSLSLLGGEATVSGGTFDNRGIIEGKYIYGALNVENGATLTVTGATVYGKRYSVYNKGIADINGGNFVGSIYNMTATDNSYVGMISIKGGTFLMAEGEGSDFEDKSGILYNSGRVAISGGEFEIAIENIDSGFISTTGGVFSSEISLSNYAVSVIDGGTFPGRVYNLNDAAYMSISGGKIAKLYNGDADAKSGDLFITGGTFGTDPSGHIDTGICSVTAGADSTYTVTLKDDNALSRFLSAVYGIKKTGGTVTLTDDITLPYTLYLCNFGTKDNVAVIDLDGHTVNGNIFVSLDSNAVIRNGTVKYAPSGSSDKDIDIGAIGAINSTLVVESVTVKGSGAVALYSSNSNVTVDGSIFSGWLNKDESEVTVMTSGKTGTLTLKNNVAVESLICKDSAASVVLSGGGTYNINGIEKNPTEDYTLTSSDNDISYWTK